MPTLDEVREQVQRDFDHARREQMNEAFYATLRARYEIEIEITDLAAPNATDMPMEETSVEARR